MNQSAVSQSDPNPSIEKQTQINSVLQTPAVIGLLNYLDQSTQFFLQLPNHKTEHFRECSTVRNLHIKFYACLFYETRDKLALQINEQTAYLQDKLNTLLDAITYSYGGILSPLKCHNLQAMIKPDMDITDRFAQILQQCKTLLNLWPVARTADYKSAMEMSALFTFMLTIGLDKMAQAGHTLDNHLFLYFDLIRGINLAINTALKVDRPASLIPYPEF